MRAAGGVPLRTDELAYAWMDDPLAPLQIGLLGVLDAAPFTGPDGRLDVDRVRAELAERARRVPELGRRVRWTRPGRTRAAWVPAEDADPLDRIRVGVLPPGEDLLAWAAERAVRPLEPDRPLWRVEVVDGLPGGRFGLLAVLHHVLADGAAAVALLTRLLDVAPDARPELEPTPAPAPPPPAPARRRSRIGQLREVLAGFRSPEPAVPLPRRTGPGRCLAAVGRPLADVRATGHALGVSINDLVLAAVTAGLGDLLVRRGTDPDGLVLRTTAPAATGRPGQVMGLMVVGLPVGEPDPVRRLARVHAATSAAKTRLRAPGGDATEGLARLPAPLARLLLVTTRWYGARRVTLSVTDVAGPPQPLWLAGARLLSAVPIAPLVRTVPLSVAALSYAGDLVVAVNADARVRDAGVLAAAIGRALDELRPPAGRPVPAAAGTGTRP